MLTDGNKSDLELHLGEIRVYFSMTTHHTVYCAASNFILGLRFRVEVCLTIVQILFTLKAFCST
jgi:hypothetical protein